MMLEAENVRAAELWSRVALDPMVSRLVLVRVKQESDVLVTVTVRVPGHPIPSSHSFRGPLAQVMDEVSAWLEAHR